MGPDAGIEQSKKSAPIITNSPTKFYILTIFIVTLISAGLRFRNLDGPSLWVDELATLDAAMQPTWEASMQTGDSMFGMYGWTLHHLLKITGNSDFAVRSISAICGVLLIPLVSEYGRLVQGERAGIIASSMLAVSFHAIKFSQEFRQYMLVTFVLWSMLFLIRNHKFRIPVSGAKIAIVSVGFCWSFLVHYLAGLVVLLALIPMIILDILSRRNNSEPKSLTNGLIDLFSSNGRIAIYALASVCTLGAFVAPIILSDSSSNSHSNWIPDTPDNPHLVLLTDFFGHHWWGNSVDGFAEGFWFLVMISPLVMICHQRFRKQKELLEQPEWMLWSVSIGTLAVVVIYSDFVRNLWVTRYFVFSMPAWYLLFGVTLSKLLEFSRGKNFLGADLRTPVAVIFASIFIINGVNWIDDDYSYYDRETKSDFEEMSMWLHEESSDSDYIISQPGSEHWNLYLQRMGSSVTVDSGRWGTITEAMATQAVKESPERVIHIRGHGVGNWNAEQLVNALELEYEMSESYTFVKGQIDVYERVTQGGSL